MKKVRHTTMEKLRSAILGTEGPGSLYRWLRRHHDEMVAMLGQVSRPDWKAITAALVEEKLLDAKGKQPTAERVRQTWVRVRADVKEARDKRSSGASRATREGRVAPDVKILEPAPKPQSGTDDVMANFKRDMNRRSGRKDDD